MKKLTILLVAVLFTSCTESKEKQLVSNHEQRIGNTQTDLNLKFQKFEFVKDFTAKDSALILKKYFEEKKLKKITLMQDEIKKNKSVIKGYEVLSTFDKDLLKEITKDNYKEIERYQSIIDLYNGDCKDTFLEPILKNISDFELKPDSILAKEYDVTYTILNPLLNNVKQTLSKTYYINTDKTKILNSVTQPLE